MFFGIFFAQELDIIGSNRGKGKTPLLELGNSFRKGPWVKNLPLGGLFKPLFMESENFNHAFFCNFFSPVTLQEKEPIGEESLPLGGQTAGARNLKLASGLITSSTHL